MASLRFDDVSKSYDGEVLALSHVSLDVADGEFVVLVGPSGCGKSTLLRSAAGLEELSHGDVVLDERAVTQLDPGKRDMAMVFQNYALYPHMTVYQNMAFALEQRKLPAQEIKTRVAAAARTLGLEPYLQRKPGMLSGGQRQRVAMGRAIVREPKCFLMDEPLSNLDAALRVQMRAELKLLNRRLGVTTLYVTHDQVEAMTMGDRVAVLSPVGSISESSLKQFASPDELYNQPADLFVASFIGSPAMNIIKARLVLRKGRLAADLSISEQSLLFAPTDPRTERLKEFVDKDVLLGIRAEHFSTEPRNASRLRIRVLLTEMTGPDGFVFFELLNGAEAQADSERIVARVEPRHLPKAGAETELSVDMERIHVFDPQTKLALR